MVFCVVTVCEVGGHSILDSLGLHSTFLVLHPGCFYCLPVALCSALVVVVCVLCLCHYPRGVLDCFQGYSALTVHVLFLRRLYGDPAFSAQLGYSTRCVTLVLVRPYNSLRGRYTVMPLRTGKLVRLFILMNVLVLSLHTHGSSYKGFL